MNKLAQIVFYLVVLLLLTLQSESFAQSSVKVGRSVIAGGGSRSETILYRSSGTIGQASTGRSTTTIYKLASGFWSGPSPGSCCVGTTGDLNADGRSATILDLTFLVDFIYRGGPDPVCVLEGDLDGNGTPNTILDLTFIVDYIFRGGDSPSDCP